MYKLCGKEVFYCFASNFHWLGQTDKLNTEFVPDKSVMVYITGHRVNLST